MKRASKYVCDFRIFGLATDLFQTLKQVLHLCRLDTKRGRESPHKVKRTVRVFEIAATHK